MPQKKTVVFDTVYKTATGTNNLTIILKRQIEVANIIESDLNLVSTEQSINNKLIQSGNLGIVLKSGLKNIDVSVDANGHLIISGEDAANYSLNDNGHLIYTYR